MKVGLVWRDLRGKGRMDKYLEKFVRALRMAGHTLILFISKQSLSRGLENAEIRIVHGASPRAFANGLAACRPRDECDYLFSFEPVWDCDCYLAINGVHRSMLDHWKNKEPVLWHWLRRCRPNGAGLLAVEEKAFHSGFAKNILVCSRGVKEAIVSLFDFPAGRIEVVYDGIAPKSDGPDVPREELRRQLGIFAEDYVVYCGDPALSYREYRFAIEGINQANLSQPLLLIPGRHGSWMQSKYRRTRLTEAHLNQETLLAVADVFLFPAVYDPFASCCLEALAAGLPVITTDTTGIMEIIKPGRDGEVLMNPSEPTAVARAIEAWADPRKRQEIRQHLVEVAMQFEPDATIKRALSLIPH